MSYLNDEFYQWQAMWDKFADKFDKVQPSPTSESEPESAPEVMPVSPDTIDILNEEAVDWNGVIERVEKVFNPDNDLFALRPNPITVASKGKDQELRVTPNFTDGDELRELNQAKMELHNLEGRLLASEIQGKAVDSLRKELAGLKERIENLSNLLTPNQEEDVT